MIKNYSTNNLMAESISGSDGFFKGIGLSQSELVRIRQIIRDKWVSTLISARPDCERLFQGTQVSDYHKVADLVDHAAIWVKTSRVFSVQEVTEISGMSLFHELRKIFGPLQVIDIGGVGYPEIYWRLVRPGKSSDVAGTHTDAWFWEYTNGIPPEAQNGIIKVWIAIDLIPGTSGLSLVPGSHLKEWPHHAEMRHGMLKPVLDIEEATLNQVCVDTLPGEAIVFHRRLLHKGISHEGDSCRTSIELAIQLISKTDP